jgi:hypothetical protein
MMQIALWSVEEKNMYAVVGTLLIAVAVLGFTVVMLASRKPNPAAWAQNTLTHQAVTIGSVFVGGSGIGSVIQSIGLLKEQPLTATQMILLASILVVFAFVWSRLKVRATLAEYERQTESATQRSASALPRGVATDIPGTSPGAPTPEDPSSPTRPRTPHVPKKAA